jgi:hypothetical protein
MGSRNMEWSIARQRACKDSPLLNPIPFQYHTVGAACVSSLAVILTIAPVVSFLAIAGIYAISSEFMALDHLPLAFCVMGR